MLLLTLDTTRADRLGCYGHTAARTPTFDACAQQGILFEQAYSATPMTLPSHVSILTGTYPCEHQVRDNGLFELGDEALSVAEVLRDQGYQTGAFVGTFVIDAAYGTGQGFDHFAHPVEMHPSGIPLTELPADGPTERFVEWLQDLDDDRPFFAWLHFYDPHMPYTAPEALRAANPDPYDAEIAYCDQQYARALEAVAARFPDRELLQILTADHGESKGEHGEDTHGVFVYDAVTQVPYIVVPPASAGVATPQRIQDRVSNVSVASTLLRLLDLPEEGHGVDTLQDPVPPVLDAGYAALPPTEPVYLETYLSFYSYRWAPVEALVADGFKYLHTNRDELYHLDTDPGELQDLVAQDSERATAMRQQLEAFKAAHPSRGWESTQTLDPQEAARLIALGYKEAVEGLPDFSLPDPKDAIQTQRMLDEARAIAEGAKSVRRRDPEEAERLFAECEKRIAQAEEITPGSVGVLEMRGRMHFYAGRRKKALPYFEQATRLVPRMPQYHFFLGECYLAADRPDWAELEYRKCIALQPNFVQAYQNLGRMLEQQGEYGKSAWLGQRLLESFEGMGGAPEAARQAVQRTEARMRELGQQPTPLPLDGLSMQPEGAAADQSNETP